MQSTYRESAVTVGEIEPFARNDGERVERWQQTQRSMNAIEECRPVRVSDWFWECSSLGVFLTALTVLISLPAAVLLDVSLKPSAMQWLIIGGAALAFLLTANVLLSRRHCRRKRLAALKEIAPEELAWHHRTVEINDLLGKFDSRLEALKDYDANAEKGYGVSPSDAARCATERAVLDARRRALGREEAIRKLKASGYYGMVELFAEKEVEERKRVDTRLIDHGVDGTDFTVADYRNRWQG